MFNPSLESAAVIHTATILIQQNPELAALLIILILILDTLYVYRMLKRVWKKPTNTPANTHCSKNKHRKTD